MDIAPGFLIAFPHLLDENFRQSVVLLLQQTDEGAMGLVINRVSPLLVSELCEDHEITYAGAATKRVREGGPLHQDQGLVLYDSAIEDPDGQEVIDGLQVSAARSTLSNLCGAGDGRFHCYAGYAGWGPGQLEQEIAEGTWVVSPADARLVLDSPTEEIWPHALRSVGIDPTALVPGGDAEA